MHELAHSSEKLPSQEAVAFISTMSEAPRQIVFPPDVLARIAPDISLQRHLSVGLRPSLRGFTEFKPVEVSQGGLNELGNSKVVGLAVVKSGDTRVICGITVATMEQAAVDRILSTGDEAATSLNAYSSVYPVVDIARGRLGAPTDEEMILSQKLYETVLHSKLIANESLRIVVGTKVDDQVLYPSESESSEDDLLRPQRDWLYVLYAHIKVFSRSGPLFDICHAALLAALRNCVLPQAYIDDKAIDIKIPVRSRGNFGHLKELYALVLDLAVTHPLRIEERTVATSSSFGVIDIEEAAAPTTQDVGDKMEFDSVDNTVLLADLEGEAEEACAVLKLNVVATNDPEFPLKHVSIIGGGLKITRALLQESIRIARVRAEL